MPKFIDLTGKRFGSLTVIKRGPDHDSLPGRSRWLCLCACKRETLVFSCALRGGATRSCGRASCKKFPRKVLCAKCASLSIPPQRIKCKACTNAYLKFWNLGNPDKYREIRSRVNARKRMTGNSPMKRAVTKKWKQLNRGYIKKYERNYRWSKDYPIEMLRTLEQMYQFKKRIETYGQRQDVNKR